MIFMRMFSLSSSASVILLTLVSSAEHLTIVSFISLSMSRLITVNSTEASTVPSGVSARTSSDMVSFAATLKFLFV